MIATIKKQELGIQGLPVIPIEEIRNAKVVVEQEKARVRFVLREREIVFHRSGSFEIEAIPSGPTRSKLQKHGHDEEGCCCSSQIGGRVLAAGPR